MSEIKVSIIVPLYQCESFLTKCLNSILAQTLNEIEVILVNDGSPDKSGELAEQYARKDARIKVIHQSNRGPGAARNKGIAAARGTYIGFVDSDDWIEPDMYEHLYHAANGTEAQIAMCNYIEEHANTTHIVTHPFSAQQVLHKKQIVAHIVTSFATNHNYGYYSLWNKLYKKEWMLANKLIINEGRNHGEDWWFNLDALSMVDKIVFLKEAYYHYMRINTNSLMLKYNEHQFELFLSGREQLFTVLNKSGIDIAPFLSDLDKRFVEECLGYICKVALVERDRNQAYKKIRYIVTNVEFTNALESYIPDSLLRKVIVNLLKKKKVSFIRPLIRSVEKTKNYLQVLKPAKKMS